MKRFLASSLLCLLWSSCGSKDTSPNESDGSSTAGGLESLPLKTRTGGGSGPMFTELPSAQTGVDFVNPLKDPATHPMRRLYASSMVVGGIAVGDIDGDDKPDLYFVNGPTDNQLYRQTDDFKFENITASAKVDGGGQWGVGTAMVDIDNDGDLDIYVCNHGSPNLLYINDGKGHFEEKAKAFGLDLLEASHTPAFCDYDRDGNLDLYLLTNKYYHKDGKLPKTLSVAELNRQGEIVLKKEYEPYLRITRVEYPPGGGAPIAHWEDAGRPDYLYRNNGNGTFSDVTKQVGIDTEGWGLSATWWDYDDDGYTDLYVGNDFDSPDALYHNKGDGTFENVIETMAPHTTWFSMGADFGDLNGDGHFDLLIADMSGTNHYKQKTTMGAMGDKADFLATAFPRQYMRNALYIGSGRGRFMEGAYLAGLSGTDWTWTVKLCDFDNDGRDDVYFSNGMSKNFNESDNKDAVEVKEQETQWDRHMRSGTAPLKEQNLAYRNLGDFAFEDVSKAWGLDHLGMSYGAVHADLDRDGDLDLVVVNLEEPASVYRNDSTNGGVVLIGLKGQKSNLQGIGARLTVEAGGKSQKKQLTTMRGYMASHEALEHFGIGEASVIDRLTIDWPSGHHQEFTGLAVNRRYYITEPGGAPPAKPTARPMPEPLFEAKTELAAFTHKENVYDDFKADQLLLPNKLSQNGPGLAVGDVDGDGDDDFVLGGAVGSTAILAKNEGAWKFSASSPVPTNHGAVEDMGVLLLDVDSDGDLDLYIASGGAEYKLQPDQFAYLQDRLYLNDGKGAFAPAPVGQIPRLTGANGVVVCGDIDHDGDLDLFVGGRNVPGDYPASPESYLLRNDGGKFTNVTNSAAGLANAGMVTSAVFSDADGDSWADLLVAYEWGPVRFFRNTSGSGFTEVTEAWGLAAHTGWWNSLASLDVEGDGDLDYVALNFGLNTKYHATPEKPTLLYYGDFEGTGKRQIVEAEFEEGTLFPVRGRSCSSLAMPHLRDKFETFHAFAVAPLQSIYEPEKLEDSIRLEANTLESGVFVNEGGKFTFKPLPRIAQIAPGFGVVAQEIDGDGHPDLYIVQNYFAPQVETGQMDGGVSMLLLGKGDGTFDPVWPESSGLVVPGDAKSLVVCDVNKDAKPDFLVAQNNDKMLAFENKITGRRFVNVRLKGNAGNSSGIGARVTVTTKDSRTQSAELNGGSGYLSQSSASLTFGLGANAEISKVTVRWPNGDIKDYESNLTGTHLEFAP